MLIDGRKTMARNEHTCAVPMCFVAMQHFPEAMTDDEKMVLISLWEKAADSGPLTLPHFEDRSLIDEAFADHRWHRAILRVVETKSSLDGYHDYDNGYDNFYEAYIRAASGPRTTDNTPCMRQKNPSFP